MQFINVMGLHNVLRLTQKLKKYTLAVAPVETIQSAAHYGTRKYDNGMSHFSHHCLHQHKPPIQNAGPEQVGSAVTLLVCTWAVPISNLDRCTLSLRFLVVFAGKFWVITLNEATTLFFPNQFHFTDCSFDAIQPELLSIIKYKSTLYINTHTHIHKYIHTYTHICTNVSTYMCVCVYIHTHTHNTYVFMYVYIYTHTHIYTYICTRIHTYIQRVHTHTHTCTCAK